MSKIYSVIAKLDAKYSPETVYRVFNNAFNNKIIFFDQDIDNDLGYNSPILDLSSAVNKILSDRNHKYGRTIFAKFEDTRFSLYFSTEDPERLKICFADITFRWVKEYDNSGREVFFIDFARYIRLLLLICKDFNVFELSTEIWD